MNMLLLEVFFIFPLLWILSLASAAKANSLRALQVNCTALDCDDGNLLTVDSCDPTTGCQYTCDDGNKCTREIFLNGLCQYVDENDNPYDCSNEDGSNCLPGLVDCSDGNPFTTDICVPSTGCHHIGLVDSVGNFLQLNDIIDDLQEEGTIFYEEQTGLSIADAERVVDWIKLEVTQLRTPFCWKRSYGRGVGEPAFSCPAGKERVGLLCVNVCPSGYSRQGTLDCHQECKEGWRDDGLFCRLAEYGRGVGYPWKFGDELDDSGMFQRCEDEHGKGNCEKNGLIVYPKCKPGYSAFGCCICRPNFDSCEDEGYAGLRVDLSCLTKIELGEPTSLVCSEGLEQDGLLCYSPCSEGFDGVGPVCWQTCDVDQNSCVAGCTRNIEDCIFAMQEQLVSPLIVAANLATLGATTIPSAASGTAIEIAGVLYQFSTIIGTVMGSLASLLESTDSTSLPTNAMIVSHTNTRNRVLDGAVSATLYGAGAIMQRQFVEGFAAQTSPEIAQTLAEYLHPQDSLYIQRLWADVMFKELLATEAWNFGDIFLSTMSAFDPTGITRMVSAYAKPVCDEIFDFPVCTADWCSKNVELLSGTSKIRYETTCQDIHVYTSVGEDCVAPVEAISLDAASEEPDHGKLFLSLEPAGPFALASTPHRVKLSATDENDETQCCQAQITVMDVTPTSITCPINQKQNNTVGVCGATVEYAIPVVVNNCRFTDQATQIAGFASGSHFPVGSTMNTFQVGEFPENGGMCSFSIAVFDVEAPQISCGNLAVRVSTNPGECIATYAYQAPLATDNCAASTVLTKSPSLDPQSFPVGISEVEYTSTDLAGNIASCSFEVEVYDDQAPTANCIAGSEPGIFTIDGSDNCEGELKAFVVDVGSGENFPILGSEIDHFEVGVTFNYTRSSEPNLQRGSGELDWLVEATGEIYVVIEDSSGLLSPPASCTFDS